MPSKIVKPSESLIYLSSKILKILMRDKKATPDDIVEQLNQNPSKPVSVKKTMLSLNFLFLIGKVERDNETVGIKIQQP